MGPKENFSNWTASTECQGLFRQNGRGHRQTPGWCHPRDGHVRSTAGPRPCFGGCLQKYLALLIMFIRSDFLPSTNSKRSLSFVMNFYLYLIHWYFFFPQLPRERDWLAATAQVTWWPRSALIQVASRSQSMPTTAFSPLSDPSVWTSSGHWPCLGLTAPSGTPNRWKRYTVPHSRWNSMIYAFLKCKYHILVSHKLHFMKI